MYAAGVSDSLILDPAAQARQLQEELQVLLDEKLAREQARAAREAAATANPAYEAFKRKYFNHPDKFVRECFRWKPDKGPTKYQTAVLLALVDPNAKHRVCVRGPHTLGKTAVNAWAILWFSLTRDGLDWKCPTTAGAWRQLEKFLWPEVHKWARLIRWDVVGRAPFDPRSELLGLSLKLSTGEAFALASDNPELIEGAHADYLLYILDEAKAIIASIFDAVEGAFAGEGEVSEAAALVSSTPGPPSGKFYEIQSRKPGNEDWHVIRVTFRQVLKAGRISMGWARQRLKAWGETSAIFLNRVLGEFATQEADGIIPLSWVEAANLRWVAWNDEQKGKAHREFPEFTCVGSDVGRGGDPSTIARRYGWLISSIEKKDTPDTMALVGWIKGILVRHGGYAVVDVIGIGAGTVDRLREQRAGGEFKGEVYAFNASLKTDAKDDSGELEFANLRAFAWWHMRELLNPSNKHNIALPPMDELIGELTAPRYKMTSNGIQIESKDELRKPTRLGRSTDLADAVIQAYFPVGALQGEVGSIMAFMTRQVAAMNAAKEQAKEKEHAS